MSNVCEICGKKVGLFNKIKLTDGVICKGCGSITTEFTLLSVNDIKNFWEINKKRREIFTQTRVMKTFMSVMMTIDDEHKLFLFGKAKSPVQEGIMVYSFDELCGYKMINSNGKTYLKQREGNTFTVQEGYIQAQDGKQIVATNEVLVSAFNCVRTINLSPLKGITDFFDECLQFGMEKYNSFTYDNLDIEKSNKVTQVFDFDLEEDNSNNDFLDNPDLTDSEKLIKLMQLKEEGRVTEEEYIAFRNKLLGL